MTVKMGRPSKENPKNTRIQIRLDKNTLNKLDCCVRKEKSNRSEIIRNGIDLMYAKIK